MVGNAKMARKAIPPNLVEANVSSLQDFLEVLNTHPLRGTCMSPCPECSIQRVYIRYIARVRFIWYTSIEYENLNPIMSNGGVHELPHMGQVRR